MIHRLALIFALTLFAPELSAAEARFALPPQAQTPQGALHVLNRLGFGPRPGEVDQVLAQGVGNWIARQFNPQTIPEPAALISQLSALPTLTASDGELYRRQAMLNRDKSDGGKEAKREFDKNVITEAATARLDRAILSDRQLQEVLVGFWFNHFNVFRGKGLDHVWVGTFESESIRPYVFGTFRTLLEATARHPAMLYYLDNWQNSAPGSSVQRGKELGLNENYARELMELHTLGVDGGYSQQDVTELARILTGWGLRDRSESGPYRWKREADYTLAFDPKRHDYGDKTLLGHVIHGEGWKEVEKALDILCASPATAHHLSFQLAQYFVADNPDPKLVDQMAKAYLSSGGNLSIVMLTMIQSPVFWAPETIGHKFKTPFEYSVSALRATQVVPANMQHVMAFLNQLGQPIYGIETPDGYKQVESAWLNPDSMARRLSFATMIGSGRLADQRFEVSDVSLRSVMPPALSPQTEQVLADSNAKLRPALLLGSPDFMYR